MPIVVILVALALFVTGCFGDQSYQVHVRNDTDSPYQLALVFESGDGYGTAVPPSGLGFANTPGTGTHPIRYVLFDASCHQVADGAITSDVVGLVIAADGVRVEEEPSWGGPDNLSPGDACGAVAPGQ
jgi:hypothetical protein